VVQKVIFYVDFFVRGEREGHIKETVIKTISHPKNDVSYKSPQLNPSNHAFISKLNLLWGEKGEGGGA